MNDPLVHDLAKLWAQRLTAAATTDETRIALAFEEAYTRLPDAEETSAALAFLKQQTQAYQSDDASRENANELAWVDLCHTLFNVKEFIHIN